MFTRTRVGLGAGAVLLATVLAGCGDSDDGGDTGGNDFADLGYDEISEAAIEAMGSLDSVHFRLGVSAEGSSSTVDLSISADGSCTGVVAVDETATEVLRTADAGWFKPNLALLEQLYPGKGKQAAEFVGDAWVLDTESAMTAANCDLAGLVESLSDDLAVGAGTAARAEELDGREVVRLDYTAEGGSGSAYVLADGEHYIVQSSREGINANFSEFNEPFDTLAPPARDVVDLADFPG